MSGLRDVARTPAYALLSNPEARSYASDVAAYLLGREILAAAFAGAPIEMGRARAASHEAGHAVVMAAFGTLPVLACIRQSEDFSGSFWGYVDPGKGVRRTCDFADLNSVIPLLSIAAAGYCGECFWLDKQMRGAAHELGLVMYAVLMIGTHHGIPATVAYRSTLTLCREILTNNREAAEDVRTRLIESGTVTSPELTESLANIKPASAARWLEIANAGGGEGDYAAEERTLALAGMFAHCAQSIYGSDERIPELRRAVPNEDETQT